MDVVTSAFAGVITGFFIVSIFRPPKRQIPAIPTPGNTDTFYTKSGCVRVRSEEVPCSGSAVSLNVLVNAR